MPEFFRCEVVLLLVAGMTGDCKIVRNGEKKMDVSMKKVRLVRYGKGLQFQSRFIPTLTDGVSSGGIR